MSDEKKQSKGKVLSRMLKAGIRNRERFAEISRELERYDYEDTDEMYKDWPTDLDFRAKVMKTQQYKREIGSRLYSANPTFRVQAREGTPIESVQRSMLMGEYLNWAKGENGLYCRTGFVGEPHPRPRHH